MFFSKVEPCPHKMTNRCNSPLARHVDIHIEANEKPLHSQIASVQIRRKQRLCIWQWASDMTTTLNQRWQKRYGWTTNAQYENQDWKSLESDNGFFEAIVLNIWPTNSNLRKLFLKLYKHQSDLLRYKTFIKISSTEIFETDKSFQFLKLNI